MERRSRAVTAMLPRATAVACCVACCKDPPPLPCEAEHVEPPWPLSRFITVRARNRPATPPNLSCCPCHCGTCRLCQNRHCCLACQVAYYRFRVCCPAVCATPASPRVTATARSALSRLGRDSTPPVYFRLASASESPPRAGPCSADLRTSPLPWFAPPGHLVPLWPRPRVLKPPVSR